MFGTSFVSGVAVLVSALATSAAVQSRCDAQTMAAAAVTTGVANDVPGGVTAVSTVLEISRAPDAMTLIPCAGATRSTTEPRVDSFATCVEEPAASSPTPSTPGCDAGNLGLGSDPLLPTAATTSAPESCSARSDSMSAGVGFAVAETLTTCAPFLRNHPSASTSA